MGLDMNIIPSMMSCTGGSYLHEMLRMSAQENLVQCHFGVWQQKILTVCDR